MSRSAEHKDEHEITPHDQSSLCNICGLAVADGGIKCIDCFTNYHVECLNLRISPILYRSWQCESCYLENKSKSSTRSGSSKKTSKSSSSKNSSSKRIALKRIEEEKKLKEELLNTRLSEMAKINQEYLDKKYAVEGESASEEEEDRNPDGDQPNPDENQQNPVEHQPTANVQPPSVVDEWLNNMPEQPDLPSHPLIVGQNATSTVLPRTVLNATQPQSAIPPAITQKDRFAPVSHLPSSAPENPLLAHRSLVPNQQFRERRQLTTEQIAARHSGLKNLPTFSGDCDEWPAFINAYYASTEACNFDSYENLLRLTGSLKGEAKDSVKALLILPSTVNQAITVLGMLYGQPWKIIKSLKRKLHDIPSIKNDNLYGYVKLSTSVDNLIATVNALKMDSHLNDPCLLEVLVSKLPPDAQLTWGIYCNHVYEENLRMFGDWVRERAYGAIKVTSQQAPSSSESKSSRGRNYVNVHTDEEPPTVSKVCVKCNGECPKLKDCTEFKEASVDERIALVNDKKLCVICLGVHKRKCFLSNRTCGINGCAAKHNRLLHKNAERNLHHSDTAGKSSRTWFRIICVKLYNGNNTITCFAMLDEGSSVSLVNECLVKELGLSGTQYPLCLKWTGGTTRVEEDSMLVHMYISGTGKNSKRYNLSNVHTVSNLDLPEQSILQEDLDSYEHLKDLSCCTYKNARPMMLIGCNNASLGAMSEVREGCMNEPIASNTKLGWVIHGGNRSRICNADKFAFHICECQALHETVKQYFTLDSVGIVRSEKRILSVEDERAMQLLKDSTRRDGNRFVTGLLWKYENISLPDSYSMAYRRLQCLESKMRRNPDLAAKIRAQIEQYKSKNYIRKLTPEELQTPHQRAWYLPIFTVTNPNKPDKLRLVWDAAAKVNGISLNSVLLSGPDQVSSLIGVLMRFRQNEVGVTADIQEMFHQVNVSEQDQHSQRFLYRENSEYPAEVYIMQVLTFGSTSSPASAQFVKNLNADEYKDQFPDAAKAIKDSHYVDDYLDSMSNEDAAIKLCREVKHVHQQAGFFIRNWLSNSSKVESALNSSETSQSKSMNIAEEPDKILGMWWNKVDDTFQFKLVLNNQTKPLVHDMKPPTKRELLSIAMKIFDPLGLISNYMVYLKILLQEVWKSSIMWDETIKYHQLEKWQKWVKNLPILGSVRVPRWHFSERSEPGTDLHIFVDASLQAYASVAYFRYTTSNGYKCTLVASKTKVAPIKLTSVPRLELQSAVLGVRLASSIKEQHNISINKTVFWSDSRTVLLWLNTNHQTLKQFVAFRVGEILEESNVNDWRYVPSKDNVADEATKWPRDHFTESSFLKWIHGPSFLKQEETSWPSNIELFNTPESQTECINIHSEDIQESILDPTRFSSWCKMLRCLAYVLRFANRLRVPTKSNQICVLSSEELKQAENLLLRQSQQESFREEIITLKAQQALEKRSVLYKESPYLDEFGLIRVDGRIDQADGVSSDTKRPIILSRKNYICFLLVRFFHIKFHHQYDETVLNELNQKFRIGRLRVLLKKVKSECQLCKIKRAVPKPPMMSELPKARLSSFTRPFTFVGLDFFGPLNVSVGRSCQKRWILIITCLTIRAIHLEIAHSLSTDSFILSLKNFIARRGTPREIYSDNGTNFRGAVSELKEFITDKENLQHLSQQFITSETSWKFNPPASPHMGGSWERLVRSVKNTLSAIKPSRNPTDALLYTMLLECEMVINSRPLTYVALESESSEALTPNHFLFGSSSGAKPIGKFSDNEALLRKNWMKSEQFANLFWKRWTKEFLPTLTRRTKWFFRQEPLKVGDIVIIVDETNPRNDWPKGRVIKTFLGKNNQVRSASVQTVNGIYTRPAVKLAVLDVYKDGKGPNDEGTSPGGTVNDTQPPTNSTE